MHDKPAAAVARLGSCAMPHCCERLMRARKGTLMRDVATGGTPTTEELDVTTHRGEPQVRRCLRCRTAFHSEWSGERICARCKGTTAWRRGLPVKSY